MQPDPAGGPDLSSGYSTGGVPRDDSSPSDYPAGKQIGRYTILAPLGRGGMGHVYKAHDPGLGRAVALKFLNPNFVGLPSAVERFMREAKAASALNHPNIVTIYEFIQSGSTLAIAMELVEGVSLRERCGAPQPPKDVLDWGGQTARALEATHARGLIHRDIKPANIMVRPDGYVKLLDFGLVRLMDNNEDSTIGRPVGTLRYMSPEQARGLVVTGATDVFSLGLVLYELLTGQGPKSPPSSRGTEPPSLYAPHSLIPRHVEPLLRAMLNKDAAARPPASEVAKVLSSPQAPAETSLWKKVAIPVAFVAAAAAWFAFHRSPHSEPVILRNRPLTSSAAFETGPALSHDGAWAAFLSAEAPGKPGRLFVQQIGTDTPVRLAAAPPGLQSLAWKPGGREITALLPGEGSAASIVSLDRESGAITHLAATLGSCVGAGLDWAPDGRKLVYSDCAPASSLRSIYLLTPSTGERTRLTNPTGGSRGDTDPRFSPAGDLIAFRREVTSSVDEAMIVPVGGGTPRAITAERRSVGGLDWWPDGQSLVVSSLRRRGNYSLWRYPIATAAAPQLLTQAGAHAILPSVARQGTRVLWVSQANDVNIWQVPVSGTEPPKVLIASTARDQDPASARDGRIAFRSVRSGSSEIWASKADGSDPVRLTSMGGPVTGTPSWSPDGRSIAFDSRPNGNPDIFRIDCEGTRCGPPQRLTESPGSDVSPFWSIDGEHIYYSSDQNGTRQVMVIPAAGGSPVQVTLNGGAQAKESPDGRWLYFVKPGSARVLWRMPGPRSPGGLSPKAEEPVFSSADGAILTSSWVPGNEEVYFASPGETPQSPPTIRALHIATRKLRRLASPPGPVSTFGLSADQRRLLFSQTDRTESSVMVAETESR